MSTFNHYVGLTNLNLSVMRLPPQNMLGPDTARLACVNPTLWAHFLFFFLFMPPKFISVLSLQTHKLTIYSVSHFKSRLIFTSRVLPRHSWAKFSFLDRTVGLEFYLFYHQQGIEKTIVKIKVFSIKK